MYKSRNNNQDLSESRFFHARRVAGLGWLGLCLAVALSLAGGDAGPAACDAARVPVRPVSFDAAPVHEAIETVRVGQRVAAALNPGEPFDRSLGATVDPPRWLRIELSAPKLDGSWADVVLLLPAEWLDERGARVGGELEIAVPECGIEGRSRVVAIGGCPPIASGSGPVVTGTFAHRSAHVLDVYVAGRAQPLGVTAGHPFWNITRGRFVAAGDLVPGDALDTLAGPARVERLAPRAAPEPVFNLEVMGRDNVISLAVNKLNSLGHERVVETDLRKEVPGQFTEMDSAPATLFDVLFSELT